MHNAQGLPEPPSGHPCCDGHLLSKHGEMLWRIDLWQKYFETDPQLGKKNTENDALGVQVLNLAWIFVWDRSSVEGREGFYP